MMLQFIHWITFTYYTYLFGYASLLKVFHDADMIEGMERLGFNTTWTVLIGIGELSGCFALLIGIRYSWIKNAAVLYLLPYAVGALAAHLAHRDYTDYYDALSGAVAAVVILSTDKNFRITL
ncbi:MAG TPA: DoxX family protein [Chryseolinea sp.]